MEDWEGSYIKKIFSRGISSEDALFNVVWKKIQFSQTLVPFFQKITLGHCQLSQKVAVRGYLHLHALECFRKCFLDIVVVFFLFDVLPCKIGESILEEGECFAFFLIPGFCWHQKPYCCKLNASLEKWRYFASSHSFYSSTLPAHELVFDSSSLQHNFLHILLRLKLFKESL